MPSWCAGVLLVVSGGVVNVAHAGIVAADAGAPPLRAISVSAIGPGPDAAVSVGPAVRPRSAAAVLPSVQVATLPPAVGLDPAGRAVTVQIDPSRLVGKVWADGKKYVAPGAVVGVGTKLYVVGNTATVASTRSFLTGTAGLTGREASKWAGTLTTALKSTPGRAVVVAVTVGGVIAAAWEYADAAAAGNDAALAPGGHQATATTVPAVAPTVASVGFPLPAAPEAGPSYALVQWGSVVGGGLVAALAYVWLRRRGKLR